MGMWELTVNPHEEQLPATSGFRQVEGGLAAVVSEWLIDAGLDERYCVAVAEEDESSELFRVYVGLRKSSERMKLVGEYLA